MSISNSGEFIDVIKKSLGSSSSLLEPEEFEFAATQALNELDWGYPISDRKKEFWCTQRGKRHALDLLRVVSAHRFKYKQMSLGQRFEHYETMIEKLDQDFEKALNSDPVLLDISLENTFGVYLENGFLYDQFGNDRSKLLHDLGIDNDGFRELYMLY